MGRSTATATATAFQAGRRFKARPFSFSLNTQESR